MHESRNLGRLSQATVYGEASKQHRFDVIMNFLFAAAAASIILIWGNGRGLVRRPPFARPLHVRPRFVVANYNDNERDS